MKLMSIAAVAVVCAVTGVSISAQSAAARTSSFSISPTAVGATNGALSTTAITLPDSGTPAIYFGFALPADYKPDTPVRVDFHFIANNAPCGVSLQLESVSHTRVGRSFDFGLGNSGMAKNGVVSFSTPDVVARGTLVIRASDDLNQRAGDGVFVQVSRHSSDGGDTCGIAGIYAINVHYRI